MDWGFLAGQDSEIENFVVVRDDGGMHDVE
jgi:hypothetical protein